jgi:hypothetical protein
VSTLDTIPEIAALKVIAFQKLERCPKCFMKVSSLPRWLLWLMPQRPGSKGGFYFSYCRGGEPAERMHTHPLFNAEFTTNSMCSGIFREHLHLKCSNCDVVIFTECADLLNSSG